MMLFYSNAETTQLNAPTLAGNGSLLKLPAVFIRPAPREQLRRIYTHPFDYQWFL
jgi:hypothetical protein